MNNDLFMNDTFDNFVFTQTVDLYTKLKSLDNVNRRNSNSPTPNRSFGKHGNFIKIDSEGVLLKDEISFDDSAFLAESLTFCARSPQNAGNEKTKEALTVLQENKNDTNTTDSSTNILEGENKQRDANRIEVSELSKGKENIQSNAANGFICKEGYSKLKASSLNKVSPKNNKRLVIEKHKDNLLNVTAAFDKTEPQEKCINNSDKTNSIKESQHGIENSVEQNVTKDVNKTCFDFTACQLSSWGLPEAVLKKYELRNVKNMFRWQVECLKNIEVLSNYKNLVYSAPTSAGKTLVAEILAIKTIFERQKKVIFILPFISIVREKMYYFQDILGSSGVRVEGFMGSYNPPGGFASIEFAICTIEKANSLINRLLEEGKLHDIGAILVDEIHLLGDPSRGYLLELLLTKLRYISNKNENVNIQIIGMSATLPNLDHLAKWLDAELYTTNFRPIPLHEQAHVCGEIYDSNLKLVRKLYPLPDLGTDTDNILQLCLETIKESCSVLIFCPTKNWCENLAQQIAMAFFKIGSSQSEWSKLLHSQLKTDLIKELLGQLKYCPVGLDEVLRKTVSFGVAFHHAGLTMDERDIVEGAFRNGTLRILVATSTLSSGVNLPARRVIIRTPHFHGKPIDTLTYRQMIGRAGRMGKDALGESFLICQKNDYKIAKQLMSAELSPVESCLQGAGKLKRAILEVIASGVASSPNDVDLFTKCTLLAVTDESSGNLSNPIEEAVDFLRNNEFIRLHKQTDGTETYVATSLGKACLSSSIAPDEGLALFTELEKARQCFVLETELHLIYLVTPYSSCSTWGNIDWMFYLELWERLPPNMKRVGELVGVRESYIVNATRGKIQTNTNKSYHKLLIHKRFFVALALQDLVNEKPLGEVCAKFSCNRGMLQSLQQSASSFAGMVTSFSRQLGWSSVEILLSQFQDRMQFGVGRELLDLMRLPILNGQMARILYNAGIETVAQLASCDVATVENILHKMIPFESEKDREGESEYDKKQRNKFRIVWVTGKEGLTKREAAEMLVMDARRYLKLEMGLAEAKWETTGHGNTSSSSEDDELISGKDGSVEMPQSSSNSFKNCSTSATTDILEENKNSTFQIEEVQNNDNNNVSNGVETNSSTSSNNLNISTTSSVFSEESFTNIEDDETENGNKVHISHNLEINRKNSSEEDTEKDDKIILKVTQCDISNSSSFSNVDFTKLETDLQNNLEPSKNTNTETNTFSTSSSFSAINFTNIEENLPKSADVDKSNFGKTFKLPQGNVIKNEVSQLLMSPSQAELNISDSSVFSSHSNINISIDKVQSDQSLFDDSFKLQLSDSDKESLKDSGVKLDGVLDEAFSKSFCLEGNGIGELNTSDDILTSSLNEDTCNVSKKRKNNNLGQGLNTPSKKKKTNRVDDKVLENRQSDTLSSGSKEKTKDFNKFDTVNVCTHLSLLETFEKQLKQQKCFSLSLACSKVVEKRPLIGVNIVQSNADQKQPEERKFCCKNRKLEGFAVTWDGSNVFYASLSNNEYSTKVIKVFRSVLANKSLNVRMFEAKEQIKLLYFCCGISFDARIDDPKVADWILDPEGQERNLLAMVLNYCPATMNIAQLAGGSKGVGSIALDLYSSVAAKMRASVEATVTWHLVDSLKAVLKDTNPDYVKFYDVEMDVLVCLGKMEINGISVKKGSLQKLVDVLQSQVAAIEKKAFSLAGRRFNFVSSTEVAKVIGMFRGRKVSTRKQILEQNEHPISDLVLQWRKINSILTKTIYPLVKRTKGQHIRGCYITHTATGRITMHEPNLQSIAKDFDVLNPLTNETIKVSCRSAFQVPDNFCLVSADYCQLELRILAHLSQDKVLCSIMKKPGDVFRSIAAKWNKVLEDKVNDSMRQSAKHLCYGIIYGMGRKTLAEQLSISEDEATAFMDTFKNTYPGIKAFIKETIDTCRDRGYVETIWGRRRYLPNIKEANSSKRGHAERQAVNTTVQGSAADITKKAMVTIERDLWEIFQKKKDKPKLVLHLHDELIYEVPAKYQRKVAKVIKKNMESSAQLSVPFPVKVRTGSSWGQMTEYIV